MNVLRLTDRWLGTSPIDLFGPDRAIIALTEKERQILSCLAAAGGAPVPIEDLLREVWHEPWDGAEQKQQKVAFAISKLRGKVGTTNVVNHYGDGYALRIVERRSRVRPEATRAFDLLQARRALWMRGPWGSGVTTAARIVAETWDGIVGPVQWVDVGADEEPSVDTLAAHKAAMAFEDRERLVIVDGLERARRYLPAGLVDRWIHAHPAGRAVLYLDAPPARNVSRMFELVVDVDAWSATDLARLVGMSDPDEIHQLMRWSGGYPGWALPLVAVPGESVEEAARRILDDPGHDHHRLLLRRCPIPVRHLAARHLKEKLTNIEDLLPLRAHGAHRSELILRILASGSEISLSQSMDRRPA